MRNQPFVLWINKSGQLYDCNTYSSGLIHTETLELIRKAATKSIKHNKKYNITSEVISKLDKEYADEVMADFGKINPPKPKQLTDLYLILDTERNTVKIGISKDSKKRLSQLQCSNTSILKLIYVIKNKSDLEVGLHKKFSHLRVSGEWFINSDEIISHFNSLEDGISL